MLGVNSNFFDCKNMKIDHFAISGTNLGEATEYIESTLGFKMQKGGKHEILEPTIIYWD